jgi:hypothetical protein
MGDKQLPCASMPGDRGMIQDVEIRLDPKTRSTFEGASSSERRMVRRARIVLLAADGLASRKIAWAVGVMTGVVSIWRNRN